jgi:hypothetical protein
LKGIAGFWVKAVYYKRRLGVKRKGWILFELSLPQNGFSIVGGDLFVAMVCVGLDADGQNPRWILSEGLLKIFVNIPLKIDPLADFSFPRL